MFVGLRFSVDFIHDLFQSFIIHDVILAFLRVVRGCKDNEIRSKGVEHRRNGSKAVAATGEIDIFLSQRQKELLHINAVAWTYVRLAVIEDEETVDEIVLDVFEYLLFSVTDNASCASVLPDSFRIVGMHERYVLPLVFVRRDYEGAPSVGKRGTQYLAQDCCLACARLSNEHHLKHLTRRFFLLLRSFRLLLFLLLQLRIV